MSAVIEMTDEAQESDLPEGWQSTTIGAVFDINPPKTAANALRSTAPVTFVPMAAVDDQSGIIAAPQERKFADVRKGYTSFRENDVIFAKITPCMENGKAAITRRLKNGIGFGSTEFHVLRPTGAALSEYLYHFIRQESFRREAENHMTGSVGQKRVPTSYIQEAHFPLSPLAEQKRIVAKIEALLARVNVAREHLAKAPTILKRFRQAVLTAACSGRLTESWRETNPVRESGVDLLEGVRQQRKCAYAEEIKRAAAEGRRKLRAPELFEDFESKSESELPSTWATCAIGAIFSVETGATPLRKRKEYYEKGTVPWVKTGEVQNCEILNAEENITELAVRDTNAKVFPEGTILIAMYGEGKTRGQVGRLKIAAATNQACAALVNSSIPQELNEYVYLFCLSQYESIRQEAVGGNQPNLNLEKVKTWQLNLPPLIELQEIVRHVEALFKLADAIEKRVATATIRADKLTQAILSKAFRGELVPTEAELARREDRDYETATQLLDRITADRQRKFSPTRKAKVAHKKRVLRQHWRKQ